MKSLLTLSIGLLSAAISVPAIATEFPLRREPARQQPQREPARQQPQREPARQQVQQQRSANWSGGQLGASNGVSSVNNNFVEPGAYVCPAKFPHEVSCFESPFSFTGHPVSYTIGPFLGYRWQLGSYVAGVEADWSWKRGGTSAATNIPQVCFDVTCANYRSDFKAGSVRQDWDSSFRLRYGYLVTPWTLVYATGGLALGQISGSFSYTAIVFGGCGCGLSTPTGTSATANMSWTDVRVGGTVGGGIETEVWAGWKARLEYRYTDFGSYTKTVPVSTACDGGCSVPSTRASVDLRESFHTVRLGLGFDF
jgi:outer membrane immunogenic protein